MKWSVKEQLKYHVIPVQNNLYFSSNNWQNPCHECTITIFSINIKKIGNMNRKTNNAPPNGQCIHVICLPFLSCAASLDLSVICSLLLSDDAGCWQRKPSTHSHQPFRNTKDGEAPFPNPNSHLNRKTFLFRQGYRHSQTASDCPFPVLRVTVPGLYL